MVGVCCGCIAKPASVQPRKTYNTLVHHLFDEEAVKTDEPIDSSMRRKIQKLQEYVQANPAKIPKVSRRLMRRIKASLLKPVGNLGHVKVAVHTYAYLLARSTDEVSSYSPSFFAREVVQGPESVVPILLKDIHIEMRTLGAELLAVFTKVQPQVDIRLDIIQGHVPQVCKAAQAALSADRREQKLQETAERRRAGDKLAVPNPIDLVARREPSHIAALEVSCLRCLNEVVELCRRTRVLPVHLSTIQAVLLDHLRTATQGAGGPSGIHVLQAGSVVERPAAPAAAAIETPPASVVDAAFYQSMGIARVMSLEWDPQELAGQLLQVMGGFMRDVAVMHKVLEGFYEHLDEKHKWQDKAAVQSFGAVLSSSGDQHQYPLYTSLLRHASSDRLQPADCVVVLQLAAQQGTGLQECYSLAALAMALHEMPGAWAEQAKRAPKALPGQAFLGMLRTSLSLSHRQQPPAAAGSALESPTTAADYNLPTVPESGSNSKAAATTGTAYPAAANAASSSNSDEASSSGRPSAGGKGHDGAAFAQQLGNLRLVIHNAVRQLASRVGSAEELWEAVSDILAAVTVDLGLTATAAHQPGSITTDAAGRATTAASIAAAAAGPATTHLGLQAAAAVDAQASSSAAVDNMMLQCAAAATDAFVHSRSQSSAGGHASALATGVLPLNVVAAVLPLLWAPSPAVRRPVQHILGALVPNADKGVASDEQAQQLVDAASQELLWLLQPQQHSSAAAQHSSPSLYVFLDGLLRCCLRGPQPRPMAALQIGRMLLQLQRLCAESGYVLGGNVSVATAHSVLLLAKSQLAALAGVLDCSELLSHQLHLNPQSCPALHLAAQGLVATGAAYSLDTSNRALTELQQQQPPGLQRVQALQAALAKAPVLVAKYGDKLQQLLGEALPSLWGIQHSDASGRAEKAQLTDKVNALLVKRMHSLRKDLVHVSELMRDSITRMQEIMPVSTTSGASPGVNNDATAVASSNTGVSTAYNTSSRAAKSARIELSPSGGANEVFRTPVSLTAGLQEQHSQPTAEGSQQQPQQQHAINGTAIRADDVILQGLQGHGSSDLCSKVSAILKHHAAAPVVQDVQVSRLAAELEPVA